LKSKILQSPDFKVSEAKQLPNTLKGLVDIAKKLGLDIKKISLDEVKQLKSTNTDIRLKIYQKNQLIQKLQI